MSPHEVALIFEAKYHIHLKNNTTEQRVQRALLLFFSFFYIREEWKKAHQGIWGAVREIKQQTGRKKLPQAFTAMQRTFENLTKTLIEIMLIE